jgi:hypothetical protein
MKKLIYLFIAVTVASFTFASCGSDDDDNAATFATTPEKDAQGTYTGTYYRVQVGTTDTTAAEGTLAITPTDTAYIADVSLVCATFSVNSSVVTNISHANDGFVFSNHLSTNTIKSEIVGRIDNEKNVETHFSLSQRSGRRTVTFNYIFIGKK